MVKHQQLLQQIPNQNKDSQSKRPTLWAFAGSSRSELLNRSMSNQGGSPILHAMLPGSQGPRAPGAQTARASGRVRQTWGWKAHGAVPLTHPKAFGFNVDGRKLRNPSAPRNKTMAETILCWYLHWNHRKPGFLRCEMDFANIHSSSSLKIAMFG